MMSKAPLAIFVSQKYVPGECKVQKGEGSYMSETLDSKWKVQREQKPHFSIRSCQRKLQMASFDVKSFYPVTSCFR